MNTLTTTAVTWGQRWEDGPHDGGFPFFIFPAIWLTILAAVIVTVVLSRRHRERTAGRRAGERALAEAFAAGEIDDQTYRARRAVLREKD